MPRLDKIRAFDLQKTPESHRLPLYIVSLGVTRYITQKHEFRSQICFFFRKQWRVHNFLFRLLTTILAS